ncbi:MAG: cobalamin-binding protein [Burkholderiales bacterium]|nr:cobalamin-binding protein [Burkholderiales bacterium]
MTDDLGRKVEMKAPAKRIVTLAPFLTELVYSAGAGANLVGVSAYSDYPAEAKMLPRVATAVTLSIEPLVALRPDLVLAWRDTIRPEDIERLERFGIAVLVVQARRLDDVPRVLELIGRLAGRDVASVAHGYSGRLEGLRRAHAGQPPVKAFLEIWHRPLTTIAGEHWMNEALELCGGANVFRDLAGVAPLVSWEQVYARDPRVVVGAGSAASAAEFTANWKERATLAAVREGRLVFVDADTIQRPTLRLAEGVAQLCAGLDRVR